MKIVLNNYNKKEGCVINLESNKITIKGKYIPPRGPLGILKKIIIDVSEIKFEDKITIDVTGFTFADSNGIKKVYKILKVIKTKEVVLKILDNNDFHKIEILSMMKENPYIKKVELCS
jgi:hypothetical protein